MSETQISGQNNLIDQSNSFTRYFWSEKGTNFIINIRTRTGSVVKRSKALIFLRLVTDWEIIRDNLEN